MRPWIAVALIVAAFVPAPVEASCAAPMVEVASPTARPGDNVRVTGKYFMNGCDDVGGSACGLCGCQELPREREFPITDVRLELRHAGKVIDTAVVDANDEFQVQARLSVPQRAKPGRYVVVVSYWGRVNHRVPVVVGPGSA